MSHIEFTHALNQRVRHPSGITGRVVGLLAGLEGRRLANVQHLDQTGNLRSFWTLESDLVAPATVQPPPVRATLPEIAPAGITHVRGRWHLVFAQLLRRQRWAEDSQPTVVEVPVAVMLVSDEWDVHERTAPEDVIAAHYVLHDFDVDWYSALQRFVDTGEPCRGLRTGPSHPVAGPSAREIIDVLYDTHVAPNFRVVS